jgi:transcriptional regulator with XRE-family HTH domain
MSEMLEPSEGGQRFRDNLKDMMQRENVSISELARRTGFGRPSLSRILNGHEDCTLERAYAIANALQIPLAVLVGEKLSVIA